MSDIIQRYSNVVSFFAAHRRPIPRSGNWRLTEIKVGSINALPNARGQLVATDGILCYLEREDGTLFIGHLDYFVPDEKSEASPTQETSSSVRRATKASLSKVAFEGLLA